jgi:signal transduction histidine kinase
MILADGAERVLLESWLRQNEGVVLARLQEATRQHLGAAEHMLQNHVLIVYYDRFCQAVLKGQDGSLKRMLRGLVADHMRPNHDIRQLLQFPSQLKSIFWRLVLSEFPARQAEVMLDLAEPILDDSTAMLVEAYAQATESRLGERMEELDVLARRLASRSQEIERTYEQLQSLYNISKAISSSTLDIHETLEAIADNLVALPSIECCAIWLATSDTTLQVGVIKGMEEVGIGNVTLSLKEATSFVTQAFLTRQEQHLERPDDALSAFLVDGRALAIPMVNENRSTGVVMIMGRVLQEPSDVSTVSLLRAATEQAAIALENAQLYTRVLRFSQELEATVWQRTQELERVNRDLERIDRTKSDFINIAAHELKTPLTLIQGYTHIMREDAAVQRNSSLLNLLNGISRGSDRLRDIVESMIDVSLIDSQVLQLRPAPTSIRNLMRTLAEQYAPALKERKLTFIQGEMDELPYIEADSQRLYQVLDNLFVNAIKYTPDGGWIRIDGSMLDSREGTDWIELVFSDSGIGIDTEHHERIFEKFYQTGQVALHSSGKTKFRGGGPGLGLAIAKGIVEAHGGRIWVESDRYDEANCPGSQFHIVLPVQSMVKAIESHSPFSYTGLDECEDAC